MCVYVCTYLSIYIYLSIYLYLCLYLSIYLSIYLSLSIYIHTYINLYPDLPRNVIVRLPYPWSGNVLAPSADKQTCNFDTECSNHIHLNHHKALGVSRRKMKW